MSSAKCREQGSESESDSLWYIDGKGYDAAELVRDHPGGCEAIRLGRGIDCSALFHSYHLIKKPELPAPCRLENVDSHGLAYTFDAGGFFDTVQQRAREYFQERRSGTHGSIGWQVVSVLNLLATAFCLYLTFVTGSLWAALAHGLLRALSVVGPAHAATHFALFRRGRWNVLAYRIASPLLISNFHFWSQAHVVGHHVHTNTPMDLQVHYPLKRVREAHGRLAFHRFQGIYMWVVYALGIPLWTLHDFLLSFLSFFTGTFAGQKLTVPQRIEAALTMTANVLINLVLPFIYLDPWTACAALLVSSISCSFVVILQNVVNHEVPDVAEFVNCDNIDWGAHQVLTSHDYAVGSRWALYCSGGLNLQIEHHLFPSVHYCHYPALAVIVHEACAEFGLPYHASSTFWEALKKHHSFLRLRARAPGVT